MAKVKTKRTRQVPRNLPLQKWYYNKLLHEIEAMQAMTKREVLKVWRTNKRLANTQDRKPCTLASEQEPRFLERGFCVAQDVQSKSIQLDASPSNELNNLIKKLRSYWQKRFKGFAETTASQFVNKGEKDATNRVKNLLKEKKVTVKFTANKELIDIIKSKQYENISLISSIESRYMSQVETIVMQGVQNGRDYSYMVSEFEKRFDVSKDEAIRIARDQVNKITEQISIKRGLEAGIKKARWVHIGGKKTSRADHVAFDGQVFYLEDTVVNGVLHKAGLKNAKGEYVIPGQEINCNCTFEYILEGDDE